jgi:hypothetical protein
MIQCGDWIPLESGNDPTGSVKGDKFFDALSDCPLLKTCDSYG